MKIGIDAQLAVGTATGIGEYVGGLIDALRALDIDVIDLSEPSIDPWRFDRRVYWDQVLLPQRARAAGIDALHCASGTVPLTTAMPVIVTVHDVAWLRVQHHARPYARYYFGRFSVDRYRNAAAIAVDSEFSRRELLEIVSDLDPERVRVVYPGVARDYALLRRERGDGKTILVVGTVERRKNLELLVRALPFLDGARIVSVGPHTPYAHEVSAVAHALDVQDRVELRGYVSRDEVLSLFMTAAVVAMPSLYEGFGYPAAQAAVAGVACVVSNRASLPEVAGDAALVCDPDDLQGWVNALRKALDGQQDAAAGAGRAAATARFGWNTSAAGMLDAYRTALAHPAR